MAGWRLSKSDGSDRRDDLTLAQVRALLENGTFGSEDLVASPSQDSMIPIARVAALRRYLGPAEDNRVDPDTLHIQPEDGASSPRPPAPQHVRRPTVSAGEAAQPADGGQPSGSTEARSPVTVAVGASIRRKIREPVGDAELEISPMIDVVFQLLIFFMICSVMQKQHGVDVPATETGSGLSPESCVVVGVRPADASDPESSEPFIFIGDDRDVRLSMDEAARRAAEQVAATTQQRIIVKADIVVDFGSVRDLIWALRQRTDAPILTGVREKR